MLKQISTKIETFYKQNNILVKGKKINKENFKGVIYMACVIIGQTINVQRRVSRSQKASL